MNKAEPVLFGRHVARQGGRMADQVVGFVGLGRMGGPMSGRSASRRP